MSSSNLVVIGDKTVSLESLLSKDPCSINSLKIPVTHRDIVNIITEQGAQCIQEFQKAGFKLDTLESCYLYEIVAFLWDKEGNNIIKLLENANARLSSLNNEKIYIQAEYQAAHQQVVQALSDAGFVEHMDLCYLSKKDVEYIESTLKGLTTGLGFVSRLDECITMPLIDFPDV